MQATKHEVIGVWTLTNTISVELVGIEYGIEDTALIVEPDGSVGEYIIHYDAGQEDEGTSYVQWGEMRLYFDECMRVGGGY